MTTFFRAAQRYADEINKKTVEEINQDTNETNENQAEKPLNRTGTMYDIHRLNYQENEKLNIKNI